MQGKVQQSNNNIREINVNVLERQVLGSREPTFSCLGIVQGSIQVVRLIGVFGLTVLILQSYYMGCIVYQYSRIFSIAKFYFKSISLYYKVQFFIIQGTSLLYSSVGIQYSHSILVSYTCMFVLHIFIQLYQYLVQGTYIVVILFCSLYFSITLLGIWYSQLYWCLFQGITQCYSMFHQGTIYIYTAYLSS